MIEICWIVGGVSVGIVFNYLMRVMRGKREKELRERKESIAESVKWLKIAKGLDEKHK